MPLTDLRTKLENANGPDRALDVLLWSYFGWTEGGDEDVAFSKSLPLSPSAIVNCSTLAQSMDRFPKDISGKCRNWNIPRLTASLDAAVELLTRRRPGWSFKVEGYHGGGGWAAIWPDTTIVYQSKAASPPLALLLATVRSL